MDLLFKKYANPFSLLDCYIATSRLCEFITEFAKQKVEDDRWEYFLHKVWGKTYSDFCSDLQTLQSVQSMSQDDIEATIKKSMDILGNFHPEQEEGEG